MSEVKTCVVLGHFTLGDNQGQILEYAEFGYNCNYATAAQFIKAVHEMHRNAGSKYTFTNIIIG